MNRFKLFRQYGRHQSMFLYEYYSTAAAPQLSDINTTNPKPFKDIPGPTGIYNIPKFGAMFLFKPFSNYNQERFHEVLDDLSDKYGPIIKLSLAKVAVFTSDPKDIELVYKNEGKYPVRPGLGLLEVYIERTKRSQNLAILQGEKWAELRRQIQKKMVRPKSALYYIERQSEVATDLVHKLGNSHPDQVRELLFLYATESISVVCFDRRLGILSGDATEEVKKYLDNVKTFFVYVNKGRVGLPMFKYFETPMYKKFKNAADESYGFGRIQIEEVLNKCLEMKKNGTWNPEEPNFLMSLLAAETLTIDQITGLVIDLLIGGTDSTAKNLENFLDCLARYPEVQETLYQEIIEHMGQHGDLTADNLPEMKYLAACLKESFRLHYPIPFGIVRVLPVDIVLSGYHVPKGTLIGLNNRRLLLNPKYVTDPTVYRPERWLRDKKGERADPIPTVGLIPFSIGVRNCVGRRFAEQEIYLAIAKIVQNFKVSLTDEVPPPKMIYQTFGFFQQKSMFNFEKRK
ncbi:hypothetical protein SNE40_018609 [Patella caerulea]|uniref:Cytochrome P450 n=1 Tax=Patella caerulea TaxID=87958 RepID=A0AAN8P8E1_PATCE